MVSEAQKRANKKWRETHREQYNKKQLEYTTKYYYNHCEEIKEKNKEKYDPIKHKEKYDPEKARLKYNPEKAKAKYQWVKISTEFRNILIEE